MKRDVAEFQQQSQRRPTSLNRWSQVMASDTSSLVLRIATAFIGSMSVATNIAFIVDFSLALKRHDVHEHLYTKICLVVCCLDCIWAAVMTVGAWKDRRSFALPWLMSQLIILFLPIVLSRRIGLIWVALTFADVDPKIIHILAIFYFFYQLICWTFVLLYHTENVSTESSLPLHRPYQMYMAL